MSYSKGKSILMCCLASPLWRLIISVTGLAEYLPTGTRPFPWDCLRRVRAKGVVITAAIQHYPSDKTISFWWMPTQVCWRPDFFPFCLSTLFHFYLHNPCDTPINNSSVICISMPEIEDRHSRRKYGPVRNSVSCGFVVMIDLKAKGSKWKYFG